MPREEYFFGFTTEQIELLRDAINFALFASITTEQRDAYEQLYELLDVQ